jgi:hypothetical protein
MTSWVETTIPPGYRVLQDWDAVEESWCWFSYTENRETCKYGFRTRSECCRAAWRHWTASILRDRDVLWKVTPEVLEASITTGDHYVFIDLYNAEFRSGIHDYIVGDCHGVITDDVDEAMARFAALALVS